MNRKRTVDFLNHWNDLRVLVLGGMGFSTDYISRRTHLSPSQVHYRLRKRGMRLGDFRSGKSVYAQLVLAKADADVERRLRASLADNGRQHARTA